MDVALSQFWQLPRPQQQLPVLEKRGAVGRCRKSFAN